MEKLRNIVRSKCCLQLLLGLFVLCSLYEIGAMQLARPVPRLYRHMPARFSDQSKTAIHALEETVKMQKKALQIQQKAQLKYIKEGLTANHAFVYQKNTINGIVVSKYTIMLCENIVNKIGGAEKLRGEAELIIPIPYSFEIIKNVFTALGSGDYYQAVEELSLFPIKKLIAFHNFSQGYLGVKDSIGNVFASAMAEKTKIIISHLEGIRKNIDSVETDFPEEHTSRGLLFAIQISKNEIIKIGNSLAQIHYEDLDHLSPNLNEYIMNKFYLDMQKSFSNRAYYSFDEIKSVKEYFNKIWNIYFETFNKLKIHDLLERMKQTIKSSLKRKEEIINKLEKKEQGIMPTLRRWIGS